MQRCPTAPQCPASYLLDRLGSYRQGALGAYASARPLFERALAIREKALGPDHPDTAASLNNLAVLLQAQGDLAAARPLYERALAICEKALGPDHPDTATSLNNLAAASGPGRSRRGAATVRARAGDPREGARPDHPDTAMSLNNLAGLLQAQGDLAAARPLFERALAICEKALGPDHPDTATSLNNLAELLRAASRAISRRGAAASHERALAILYEKALGPDHPDTATSLNNLASLLQAQGDLAAARPLFERALAIREKALGPDHPDTATSLNNLASAPGAGRSRRGAAAYERALMISRRRSGRTIPIP